MVTLNKKPSTLIPLSGAGLSLIIAILLFAVFVPRCEVTVVKVFAILFGIILLILMVLCLYYTFLECESMPNYFLYDKKKKRNIQPDKLTFDIVNSRMSFFVSRIAQGRASALWTGDVLQHEERFDKNHVYMPLVAYKMLYDLAEENSDRGWAMFENCTDENLKVILYALRSNGEEDMVRVLKYLKENLSHDYSRVSDYIIGNRKYIQKRMYGYVRRNLDAFY
ncbi:MAG: hypothetical protein IJU20_05325 [Clostridia bacterium]|nr:hypothetical protein [Clostridia bacterium]